MPSKNSIKTIERGHIYFFYRPKVQSKDKKELPAYNKQSIQRFYIVLHKNLKPYRIILIGKKRLPSIDSREKSWGTIDLCTRHREKIIEALKQEEYGTKTRGKR